MKTIKVIDGSHPSGEWHKLFSDNFYNFIEDV